VHTRRLAYQRLVSGGGRSNPLFGILAAAAVGVVGIGACSSEPVKVDVTQNEASGTTGGFFEEDAPAGSTGATEDGTLPLLDDACVSQTSAAEQRKVALNVMLDSSGSMEELAGSGTTKWQSVQRAIRSFLVETRETDLLLGLQFFPLIKPGVRNFVCESHDDCGPDGGPCFLSTCLQGDTITLCERQSDCPGSPNENPCVEFGLCANSDPAAPTACVLPSTCGNNLGRCEDFERTCTNATQCDVNFYARPAVEIAPINTQLAAIDSALNLQPPQGLTPTVPALQGAIAHAREWATTHPDQTVVTVLATDGLPTDCGPAVEGAPPAIDQVLEIAREGQTGAQPIRTFVIGVFPPGDGASIANVNAIAAAGGTDEAVTIDAGGEVEAEFLEALRRIREGTLACQFQIPETEEQLDYFSVNLQFDSGESRAQLGFVPNEAACATSPNSWHYDVDPTVSKPSAIQVCPAVCDQFRNTQTGSISLQLGCRTLLR
jgi:hypothetical protein